MMTVEMAVMKNDVVCECLFTCIHLMYILMYILIILLYLYAEMICHCIPTNHLQIICLTSGTKLLDISHFCLRRRERDSTISRSSKWGRRSDATDY